MIYYVLSSKNGNFNLRGFLNYIDASSLVISFDASIKCCIFAHGDATNPWKHLKGMRKELERTYG